MKTTVCDLLKRFTETDANVLCGACGQRNGEHRSSDGKCPPRGYKFPKWPTTIKDEKRAGGVYDKRLDSYWSKSKTNWR